MIERDITSTLRKFAPGIYVGSAIDSVEGVKAVDCRGLPENGRNIPHGYLDNILRIIDSISSEGDVFIFCDYGINRAPAVARLYCIGLGIGYDMNGSYLNTGWKEHYIRNYRYYHRREWVTR